MQIELFKALPKNTIHMPTSGVQSKHLFIVLTPPDGIPPKIVLVNISTRQARSDTTTIVLAGEHPFLTNQESIIRYDQAEIVDANTLINAVNTKNEYCHRVDISDNLHERICNGLLQSDETPQEVIDYCTPYFHPIIRTIPFSSIEPSATQNL